MSYNEKFKKEVMEASKCWTHSSRMQCRYDSIMAGLSLGDQHNGIDGISMKVKALSVRTESPDEEVKELDRLKNHCTGTDVNYTGKTINSSLKGSKLLKIKIDPVSKS